MTGEKITQDRSDVSIALSMVYTGLVQQAPCRWAPSLNSKQLLRTYLPLPGVSICVSLHCSHSLQRHLWLKRVWTGWCWTANRLKMDLCETPLLPLHPDRPVHVAEFPAGLLLSCRRSADAASSLFQPWPRAWIAAGTDRDQTGLCCSCLL